MADTKPGGRSGPPDETTVFLNMLPVVIPCIFLIAVLIVVIALRYFNAIAEQTPEGALLSIAVSFHVSPAAFVTIRLMRCLQRHTSMPT